MKLKVSLDSNSIKLFFIDHVEKILFGFVIVFFLLFVYKAVARGRLDWQPQDLVQDAELAKKRIQETKPNPPPIRAFTKEAEGIRQAIVADDYKFRTDWDPLIFGENIPRGVPVLFPIKDLRASAGNGAFAMAPDDEEEEAEEMVSTTRGQRWVVLTGLIDHRKQKDAYDTAFQEAAQWDPQRDYPDYVFYRVERAEVDPRVETAELKWTPIHVMNMNAMQDFWLQAGTEVVDPIYLPPPRGSVSLAYPLGPLQNRAWGPEVAHPPEIPLAEGPAGLMASAGGMGGMPDMYGGMYGAGARKKSPAKGGKADAAAEESEEEAAKRLEAEKKARAERRKKARERLNRQPDEPDVFETAGGAAGAGMPGYPGGTDPMYGMRSGTGRRPMRGGTAGAMPGAMPGMETSGMASMMPGMRSPVRRRASLGEEEEVEEMQEVEYLLFRFFDFSVQPGKHYRYRVKLVLANPNYGMLPHFLERDGMEKVKTLEADWSEPSPPVAVPRDSQVLVASTRASDGSASLMMVRFEEKDGVAASEEFVTVQRGQFLNYLGRPAPETGPTGMMGGMGPMGPMGGMGPMGPTGMPYATGTPRRRDEDAPERKVDYITNALLLDVAGGGRLPGRDRSLVEPGSILLLNADGNLVVQNELDDLPEYRYHKPPETPQVAGAAGAAAGAKGKRGRAGASSPEMMGSDYATQMMGMMPGMAPPGKTQKKGSKMGGTSSGMTPGMTQGMMPGMPGMYMDSLDDKASKKKKKTR
jgi:hypothetical protein